MDGTIQNKPDVSSEIDRLAVDPKNYWQIDFLKVWMILLVLLDHSIPHAVLRRSYSLGWQRIAIPVLMVIIGFNWGKSMARKKDQSLKALYSWKGYFLPKIKRFVVPFLIIYGLSLLYLLLATLFIGPNFLLTVYAPDQIPGYHEPMLKLALMLPVWGPGNWFIPMLGLLILIFPLLYKAFTAAAWTSWVMLFGCFVIEAIFQLGIKGFVYISYSIQGFVDYRINFFTYVPLQLLSAIGLGLWLSINHRWDTPRNVVIWLLGIASFVFIIYALIFDWPDFPRWVVFDYNLFVYPYSALIVMLVLNILPKSPAGPAYRFFTSISKSTYHILMTQMLYFSIVYGLLLPIYSPFGTVYPPYFRLPPQAVNYIWFYPLNVLITFIIGTLWSTVGREFWASKSKLRKRVTQKQIEMMKAKGWLK